MEEQENVQAVQDLYAAFGRGDMPGILALLAEDVDWHFVGRPEDIPFAGRHAGHQKMVEFFAIVAETAEIQEFGPQEVMAFGEHVLSLGHEKVRVKATDQIFESDWVHLFTVRNGKVVQVREFYDTAVMAEAFRRRQE